MSSHKPFPFRPLLEIVESRRLLSNLLVTTTADSGPGSLRQAILHAETSSSLDTIRFAIPGAGIHTIAPATALPAITVPLVIDGFSQPGYAGTPLVEISGQSAGTAAGLIITCAGSTIRGLAIDGFVSGPGISITGPAATGNVIAANFIGTDPTGSQARPNGLGISISGGAHDNTIGGTVALGNLITDNTGSGVVVTSDDSVGNRVLGNRIFDDGRVTPTPTTRLRFDGSNYVSLPNDLVSTYENAETIEAWFQTTTDGVILGYQTTDPSQYPANGYVPALYVGTDGRLYGEVWSGSINQVASNGQVNDGHWHHAALVSDSQDGTESLYLDGRFVMSVSGSAQDFGGRFDQIGTGQTGSWPATNGGWYGFNGQIDDVRIWSVARSASAIEQDMTTAASGTEPGLQAYYRFDEGSGTTAFDATANHRDGTLRGAGGSIPAWVTGTAPAIDLGAPSIFPGGHQALQFDGSGSFVQLPSFTLGGALTLEAWVESDNVHANFARVFDFGDGQAPNHLIVYWNGDSGQMGWGVNDQNGNWHAITTTEVFPQGQWVHVAATVDDQGNGALYWDGQLVASGMLAVPPVVARANQYVARSEYPSDSALSGALDEVKIWSGARTAAEIQQDMSAIPSGSEAGLEAYYSFDEGSGTTAHDATANHRDATWRPTVATSPPGSWRRRSIPALTG
jgi:hypothetical protein